MQSANRQACCKGHCMLFRNANVKKPFGVCLTETL